jgi:hypothetical protein
MILTLSILGVLLIALPALFVIGATRAAAEADAWLDEWEASQEPEPAPLREIRPQFRPAVAPRLVQKPQAAGH